MKAIGIASLKGGTGKTTVCAYLGLALRDMGYRVGFLDIDVSGANLPQALGLKEAPPLGRDTRAERIVPARVEGYEIFSLASHFGKGAVLWRGGEENIEFQGETIELRGTGRYELVRQMIQRTAFSPDLDYLLVDLPPSTGDEVISLWEHIQNLWGVVLVCQPAALAFEDMERTLNMLEARRLPLLGLVGNMSGVRCPKCGETFSPFLDSNPHIGRFCRDRGVPLLGTMPFTPNREQLRGFARGIASRMLEAELMRPWELPLTDRVGRTVMHGMIKGAVRRIRRELKNGLG